MLPVSSLLNPAKSELRIPRYSSSSYSPPYHTSLSSYNNPLIEIQTILTAKQKMSKAGAIFAKGKVKGEVNFPPFENLEGKALQEVQKYKVHPFGKIEAFNRHIPYNSEKKSFLEKTGRESFEVFQYEFRLPGEEKVYTVMWDYNVGLVRITPFFKCCKYSKTTPAKMLSLNPGLKDITHSITGGALAAQGYWMPYSCALAVCATFCDHISGALIPIFGPTFPSRCTPTASPSYGRMVINPSTVIAATEEADSFRNYYASAASSALPSPTPSNSGSPRERLQEMSNLSIRSTPPPLRKRLRIKQTFTTDNLYNSDTDASDMSISSGDRYLYSPITPASVTSMHGRNWTSLNVVSVTSTPRDIPIDSFVEPKLGHRNTMSCGIASPYLSAVPNFTSDGFHDDNRGAWPIKRKAEDIEEGYDGGESSSESLKSTGSKVMDIENLIDEQEKTEAANSLLKIRHGHLPLDSVAASPGAVSLINWLQNGKTDSLGDFDGALKGVKRRRATSC